MSDQLQVIYEFSGFQVDPSQRTLLRNGTPVSLAPKAFETLLFLVRNHGRLLEKDELMKALWPESFVEEGNLSQNIFVLRRALGGGLNGQAFIQTIPRRGYKFLAQVKPRKAFPQVPCSFLSGDFRTLGSPFRGLNAFGPADARLFFGRDQEIEDLLGRITRRPVLVVAGSCGSGKSSLIRAGLIPALREGRSREGQQVESWRVAVVRPSKFPFDYLAEVLPSQLAPELSLEEQAEFITYCRNKLRLGGEGLRDIISAMVNAAHGPGQARIMLVVDQFEELFLNTSDHKTREKYIDVLLSSGCWGASVPVHLILVLRTEFYSRFLQHSALRRALENNSYHVPPMSQEQLRESIEKRLILVNAHAESGLIDSLLNDFDAEPRRVALFESVLEQLWIKCGGFGCTLTYSAYSQTGGWRPATTTDGTRDCRQGHAGSMESRSRPTTDGRLTDLT